MKYLLIAASALLLASCTRPPVAHPPQSEPIGADALPRNDTRAYQLPAGDTEFTNPLDSVVVARPPSVLDKLLGRTPKPWKVVPVVAHQPVKLGKKSTMNVYYGTANVTTNTVGKKGNGAAGDGATATVVDKPKAPTNTGSGGTVTDNTKQGQRGGAAASAPGATATATTIKPPTPWLKYGLWALGAVGGYWLLFGGGGALLLALVRRNKSTSTQA